MPEASGATALDPRRRLWRRVIRPLASVAVGDVVADVTDGLLPEGLLAATDARVHGIRPSLALEQLGRVYGDRVVLHQSPRSAWEAAADCRFAVLEVGRAFPEHLEALARLSESGAAPQVVVQGLDGESSWFQDSGWTLVELPDIDQARLALPPGATPDQDGVHSLIERLHTNRDVAEAHNRERELEIERLEASLEAVSGELWQAKAARETAERESEGLRDVIAALRAFNDEAREQLRDARSQLADANGRLQSARAEADHLVARTHALEDRVYTLEHVNDAVRSDLLRLRESQSWRIGHRLTRMVRVLTFRRPGRTDGFEAALARLEAARPAGDETR